MTLRIPIAVVTASLFAAVLSGQQAPASAQGSGAASPQEPPPVTFRVEVNYVEVDAVVTDAQGRIVTDLTQADFEVLEDGRPQKVAAFSLVNIPIDLPVRPLFAAAPIEPDVQTNTAQEGRIYTIVLDDLHTTFSSSARVKKFLRDFIERNFGANDLAAVVYTSGRGTAGQEFTNNRRLLLEAVDRFQGRRLRSEALEQADSRNMATQLGTEIADPQNERDLQRMDPAEAERAFEARTMLGAVRDLAAFMEGVRGRRKTLLLISEGVSYNIYDMFNNSSAGIIMQQAGDAVAAATRGNVAIYAIDPRGLSALEESIEVAAPLGDPGQFSFTGRVEDLRKMAQQSLQTLAEGTGGFAAINRNDFTDVFQRIVRENSTYYVLGYYPANDRRDGKFRRIEVRVKRPGLQVRSRRGYVAPRGRAPDTRAAGANPLDAAAASALGSPVPMSGVPLRVTAAAFKGPAPNASVAVTVEMRVDAFTFAEKNGKFVDRVEVAFSALDVSGKGRPAQKHVVAMDLSPQTYAAARERGFRVLSELMLPPGRYQVRVAAAEEESSRSGSVFYDLEVPDFQKSDFVMSGIAIASADASGMPTVKPSDPLQTMLPGPPTSVRDFARNDQIALFAEVYENRPGAPTHSIELVTTMRAEDGRVVFENREQRSSSDLQGKTGGYGYGVRIPLADFAPGAYVIRLEARAPGINATTGRDVLIRVR